MKKQAGFTLIELMIVITVIGILAAIVYPSYQEHIKKARRAEAQSVMLDTVNREEQYMLSERQYSNSFVALGLGHDSYDCASVATKCTNNYYEITIAVDNAAAPPEYTITAVAKGAQLDDGNLTLDSTGAKTGKW